MRKIIDITGQVFGRLTVLHMAVERGRHGNVLWACQCLCGTIIAVNSKYLRGGGTQSCGCRRREGVRARRLSHGMTKSAEYRVWLHMKRRCTNPKDSNYHNYGGRGISYGPRWEKFENFFKDMGPRPSPKHTLERADNSKGYGPDNCVWATIKEQARNRRTNVLLTYNDVTQPIAAWAEELGIKYDLLHHRISKGWSIERAFTEPMG